MEILSIAAIVSGVLSLLCLLALHFTSPEFKPSWRMVSEYAFGNHEWLLTLMFLFWSVCALFTGYLLWHVVTSNWAMLGVVLVFVSGIGALMGGLFDAKHKLHGLSFVLGVPTFPVAVLLISYHLIQNKDWHFFASEILLSAHSVWMSVVFTVITMSLLFSGFKRAGIPLDRNTEPPQKLPEGVIGINGYANRLLIVCFIVWLMLTAKIYLTLYTK